MTTKVTLRQKKISKGRQSLYLDFYPAIPHPETGKPTRREFLGLYLFDRPKNPFEKQSNNETKQLAENIRAKRQIEIQAGDYGFLNTKLKAETDFVQYFKQIVETKTGGNKNGWQTAFNYFEMFTGGKLTLSNLNENLCNEFREYLLTAKRQRGIQSKQITQSSARAYYNKFKAALKQAYKKGLIEKDLSTRIDGISEPEVQREYLTLEQLQALVNTPVLFHYSKTLQYFQPLQGCGFQIFQNWFGAKYNTAKWKGIFYSSGKRKPKALRFCQFQNKRLNY